MSNMLITQGPCSPCHCCARSCMRARNIRTAFPLDVVAVRVQLTLALHHNACARVGESPCMHTCQSHAGRVRMCACADARAQMHAIRLSDRVSAGVETKNAPPSRPERSQRCTVSPATTVRDRLRLCSLDDSSLHLLSTCRDRHHENPAIPLASARYLARGKGRRGQPFLPLYRQTGSSAPR